MLGNVRRLGKTSDQLIEGCCTAFRKRWGDLLLPIPLEGAAGIETGNLSHDQWLNELSVSLGVRAFIERPLQYFRRHDDNVTGWLANNPRAVSFLDLVTTRLDRPPLDAWFRRIQVLELYSNWVTANRARLKHFGIDSVDSALQALSEEKRSYEARAALVALSLPARVSRIWRLWRLGGYRYFHGWKSALGDVIRGQS
jgi:hypothetical protein